MATLRTIGEVAERLDLPQHVLRFWETRFKEIDPVKRAGGRRLYRPRDIELVETIRHLLYREGYTIKGVQRILKEQGVEAVIEDLRRRQSGEAPEPAPEPPHRQATLDFPTLAQPVPAENPFPDAPPIPPPPVADAPETVHPHLEPVFEFPDAPPAPPHASPPALAHPPVIVTRRLDQEQAVILREALAEIEECKRLLNLTRR
ncbi:MAG: MerR family transcriptional regulator [Methylocystis sp.]|nr:MAG: MerR family transcriptional regulator [Methylocystis sp.]